ncbi:MAG TPA: hypothetical protein VJP02_15460 [Candidatus Sulfotelmatobacter sp.]|nr:hypothetical protein [Candidatus Sulfotelmatobacter sp.]
MPKTVQFKLVAIADTQLKAANEKDQAYGFTEEDNPGLGDALSREPRPSTVDANSKADRYGTI